LKRFQRELGITSVYVTHDQIEALALSSRIAVMRDGKIMQIGTPREIYEKPANRFVAEFIGTSNFMNGTVVAVDDAVLLVETESGRLQAQVKETSAVGDQITLAVRPEGVEMRAGQSQGGINELHGEVVTRSFLGDSVDHLVRVGSIELMVRANSRVSIPAGTAVVLFIDPENLNVIPLGT
jgi:iron(III) transport system ATP-binding protein